MSFRLSVLVVLAALFPLVSRADGAESEGCDPYKTQCGARSIDLPANAASDASFDQRLPPVLPGEEVNDSGQRMKVWSSAGPVPINNLNAWGTGGTPIPGLGGIGVIVDRRRDGGGGREGTQAKQ